MDRDKRWERVKEAYDLLVEGKGKQAADMVQAMQESYDEGVTDEFIKPINNSTVAVPSKKVMWLSSSTIVTTVPRN